MGRTTPNRSKQTKFSLRIATHPTPVPSATRVSIYSSSSPLARYM